MPSYTTADIRNVLLVGHHAAGKTTLADALLFEADAVSRRGSVPDGTSFSDTEKEACCTSSRRILSYSRVRRWRSSIGVA